MSCTMQAGRNGQVWANCAFDQPVAFPEDIRGLQQRRKDTGNRNKQLFEQDWDGPGARTERGTEEGQEG